MAPRLTVIIPNWNGHRFLQTCFTSLREQDFEDFETVLVDNGSTDGSVNFVRENFPEVRIISLNENRGFSAAANEGIKMSDSEYVALLNNDTETGSGWLASLVSAAEYHPEAGFVASKLIDFHDRYSLDGAGDALRLGGLPYRLGHGEKDRGQFDTAAFVFGACAAAALYRRDMLDEIGLFDEDFVSYCEDGDLSFRAQLAGYRCLYVPDAVVYHMGSASTGGKRSATATRLGTRNSVNLLVKNLPVSTVPHILPFFVLAQITRLMTAAASGVWYAHLRGLVEAVGLLPLMLHKRKGIQKRRRVSTGYVRKLMQKSSRSAYASLLRRLKDRLLVRWSG